MKKAVFLDRDGTIIEEKNYLQDPDQVVLIAGAAKAISLLSQKGYYIILVVISQVWLEAILQKKMLFG